MKRLLLAILLTGCGATDPCNTAGGECVIGTCKAPSMKIETVKCGSSENVFCCSKP